MVKWNKRIKDLREDHDMKQEDLANKLGISKRTLLRYEAGVCEPTISVLIALAMLFDVSLDYITGIKDTTEIETTSIKDDLDEIITKIEKIKRTL